MFLWRGPRGGGGGGLFWGGGGRDPRGGGSCVFMRVARTGPPRAYPGAWLEGAGLARTAPRSRLTAPWPPAAATSRAVHTCSLLERLAGMESEVAVPGPRTAPP